MKEKKETSTESVKVDAKVVSKVRSHVEKTKQTIGGFFALSIRQTLSPQYAVRDNSDAFRKYLDDKGIKYKQADHFTILMDIHDPVGFGVDWGMYKLQNAPQYKNLRERMAK